MRGLRQILAKLASFARRGKSDRALAKEVAAHLAMLEDEFRRQGLSPYEARSAACRSFGSIEQAKEEYRDQRGFVWLEQFWQDVRHAARSLCKTWRYSAGELMPAAVSTLLRRRKGLPPLSPHPFLCLRHCSFRCAPDRVFLTKPNSSRKIEMPASLRL